MNRFKKSLPPLASLLPFEATARLGSVTKAAEELNLTQAAVSRQIRALEDNLGTKLFARRNRAVFLTDDGQALNQSVSSALETISTSAVQLRKTRKSNEIILFAQLCEGLYWLMPRLSKFYQSHQNIEVKVSVSTQPVTKALEHFDLALQTSTRNSGDCDLVFTVPDEVFPVCSPSYLDQYNYPVKITDLPNHRLLHHKVYPQDWIEWDDWLEQLNMPFRVGSKGTVYDSYPMMIQSAIEGHGIALAWRQTTSQLIKTGQLTRPLKQSLILEQGLSLYSHPKCILRPEVEKFITWSHEELLENSPTGG